MRTTIVPAVLGTLFTALAVLTPAAPVAAAASPRASDDAAAATAGQGAGMHARCVACW